MPAVTSDSGKIADYEGKTSFLGEWGLFQQRVFFLLCLSVVPNGFAALSMVFLADTPEHRCALPAHLNLSAEWRNSSIPLVEDPNRGGALVPCKCSRYNLELALNYSERGLIPGVDVNLSDVPKEGCLDGWEFDRSVYTSTIVSEARWYMACPGRSVLGLQKHCLFSNERGASKPKAMIQCWKFYYNCLE